MIFRCPNIQTDYNEAVLCLNFGTPENNDFFHLGQMENLFILGVPILKHIRVYLIHKVYNHYRWHRSEGDFIIGGTLV